MFLKISEGPEITTLDENQEMQRGEGLTIPVSTQSFHNANQLLYVVLATIRELCLGCICNYTLEVQSTTQFLDVLL